MQKLQVYITTYNRAKFLTKAIKSVLNQTYGEYSLLVLDNCSTDDTREIVRQYQQKDDRVLYYCQEKNIGSVGNINTAFSRLEGEYFCVLHDDDICHPTLFEEEVKYLDEHPECVAVSCLSDNIDENDKVTRKCEIKNDIRTYSGTEFFRTYLNYQRSLVFPPTMYRRDYISKNGIRAKKEPGPCGDVVLYMDIEKNGGELAELNKHLFSYRVYTNQDSSLHLESMLIQLMEYLQEEKYYREIMDEEMEGKKRFFRWYGKKLAIRTASKKISVEDAKKYLIQMREILKPSVYNYYSRLALLKAEECVPGLFEYGYKKIKGKA